MHVLLYYLTYAPLYGLPKHYTPLFHQNIVKAVEHLDWLEDTGQFLQKIHHSNPLLDRLFLNDPSIPKIEGSICVYCIKILSEWAPYIPYHKFQNVEEGKSVPVTMAHTGKCHYLKVLLVLL